MKIAFLLSGLFTLQIALLAQAPVILKISEGIKPGGLLSLYGEYFTGNVKVRFEETGDVVTPVQQDAEGQYIRVVMPAITPGVYTLQVSNTNGASWGSSVILNKTDPRWLSETTGYPDMKMKLMGRNLSACQYNASGATEIRLVPIAGGSATAVPLSTVTPYALSFSLPKNLPLGDYYVEVRTNAAGLGNNWVRHSETLNVIAPPTDPTALALGVSWAKDYNWTYIKNVKTDFAAKGDGSTDDSQAIQNAIDNVSTNGGGIVFFPAGTYMHTSFTLKQDVILKGEDKSTTFIKYNGTGSASLDGGDAVIKCNGTGTVGITNLTLTADMSAVTAQTTKLSWFNYDSRVFLYNMNTDFPLAATQSEFKDFGWCGSIWSGKFLVSGCNMKGTAFFTTHIPQTTFINNTVEISFGELSIWGKKSIFEGNHVMGSQVATATQHGFFIDIGGGSVTDSYYNNNLVEKTSSFMNQGEAFSTDGTGTYSEGPVTSATLNTVTVTKEVNLGRSWTNGSQVLIVKGKGLGQKVTITSYTETANSITVTLATNWVVQPDASSKCLIGDFTEDIVVENLTTKDCKVGMQYFCNGFDNVMSNCTSVNTQGMLIWAWQGICVYFCDIKNNEVSGASPDSNVNDTWIGIRDENDNTNNNYATDIYGIEYRNNRVDRKNIGGSGDIVRNQWICMGFGYNNGSVTSGKGISALLLENNTLSNFANGLYLSPGVDGTAERASVFTNINDKGYIDEGSNNLRLSGKPDSANCETPITSVEDIVTDSDIQIYPNPSDGRSLTIGLTKEKVTTIVITDLSGKPVYKTMTYSKINQLNKLSLESGLYIITFTSDSIQRSQKLIVK